MRNRRNSGIRLDNYKRMVTKTILQYQNPVTGLLPASNDQSDAWVRDNVYSILAVWGLALAYRKNTDFDEDRAKAYELEQNVVKLMRGLLTAMMKQVDKLELFKYSQNPKDSLHAKYNINNGNTVVGDTEWGHLQIDATSLYLLMLSEMTTSGLQIIFTLDEVDFIQNLVFYIEAAYRIPDYGIWERGDKTNHGLPELNASSIGMAKAALEAMSELDLFGARGGPASVIHVMPDEIQQCTAILNSMLPRESSSKEIDAGLLGTISYPAFAVDDENLVNLTRQQIINKLGGKYGCSRFLRDGYKTVKEDPSRLYYNPAELKIFDNIECEWPLFWAYLILDGIFLGVSGHVEKYRNLLESILVQGHDGINLLPELYYVPTDKVESEYHDPGSQERIASGKIPHMWGQSLYILACLLHEKHIQLGEIDPLNRRFCLEPKLDSVVQVALLAEDKNVQEVLKGHDIHAQTIAQVAPIEVHPARVLSDLYSFLGKNDKLKLSGRPSYDAGILSTSRLYMLGEQTLVFTPQFLDQQQFYLSLDNELLVDIGKTHIAYLRHHWCELGRPIIAFPVTLSMLESNERALLSTIQKLQAGYINGTQVKLGNLSDFLNTSCYCRLTFLERVTEARRPSVIQDYLEHFAYPTLPQAYLQPPTSNLSKHSGRGLNNSHSHKGRVSRKKSSVHGIIKRTRSVHVEQSDMPEINKSEPSDQWSPSSSPRLKRQPTIKKDRLEDPALKLTRGQSWRDDISLLDAYKDVDCLELVEQLKTTTSIFEQADIVHYLYTTQGPNWETKLTGSEGCSVGSLLVELYYKAGHYKEWSLVRHTAGMLSKRVEDLAQAVTDLLVRGKQITVGIPPEPREKTITSPLHPDELKRIIYSSCGEDSSNGVLTQELLFYLAMFIRTEPNLFQEMLRLRVGLIIQVMSSELGRSLDCPATDAYEHLMNLSPYEVKCLLHHILSGKEFGVASIHQKMGGNERQLSIVNLPKEDLIGISNLKKEMKSLSHAKISPSTSIEELEESVSVDRQGQWIRRRRLDGALNRVPIGFYEKVWKVLEKCDVISIGHNNLWHNMTSEMTPNELKFAINVESTLNSIPEPEYRQLMVEALMVLGLIVENRFSSHLGEIIQVNKLVEEANKLFLQDQQKLDGDATVCCVTGEQSQGRLPQQPLKCGGMAGICMNFYDSAPSGRYGTMTYLAKAAAKTLHFDGENPYVECSVM